MGPRALSIVPNFQLGEPGPGTTILGTLDWDVVVEGRLIATSRSALWTLRDAFNALIAPEPESGTLVLGDGREFTEMILSSYAEIGPVVAGRAWSVAYRAVFRYRK
jgi:hypothetical protein